MNIIKAIKKKTKGEFATKSIFSFGLKFFGLFLSYIFTLLISRLYGAEIQGKFTLAFTILNIFALVFALGIPDAIVKIASDNTIKNHYNFRKTTLVIVLLSSITGAVILYISSGFLAKFYKDNTLYNYFTIAAIILVPLIILRLNYETLRGKNEIVKFGFLSHIIPYFVGSISIVIAYYFLNTSLDNVAIKSYAIGVLIAFTVSLFWSRNKNKAQVVEKQRYSVKNLMHYSLPMLATSSFIFIMGWTDTLMLGYFNSKADVGVYSVVIKIARIAIIAITSINLVLAPKISELYSSNQTEKMKQLIRKTTRFIFIFTAPIVFIILLFNKFVLGLFGEEFIIGSTALIIIMLSQLFNAISGSVGQVMNMTEHHKKLRDFTIISALLNIVLNIVLIPLYGIVGAAIATAISSVTLNILAIYFVKNKLGIITYYTPKKR